MQTVSAGGEVPPRGVYEELYRIAGCHVLVAIDSKGDARKRVKLLPGISYDRAKRWLEELLERVDPIVPPPPMLTLVRDLPERPADRSTWARPAAPAHTLHPAHVDDYRAYRRRLAMQLSHRLRLFRD